MKNGALHYTDIGSLNPAVYNPRKMSDEEMTKLVNSIERFGFLQPVVANKNNEIIGGHQRIIAARQAGLSQVPVMHVDLPDNEAKALNLALNKISGDWDLPMLKDLLESIDTGAFDVEITGFSEREVEHLMTQYYVDPKQKAKETLAKRFVVPPFTILDAQQGYWKDRKKAWFNLGMLGEAGREHIDPVTVATRWMKRGDDASIIDPVLCEIMYKWFTPKKGLVINPMAGGSTGGLVAAYLDYKFIGIEIRQEQVDTNVTQAKDMGLDASWLCMDGRDTEKLPDKADFILCCPPYYDLEVYSDDPNDISTADTYTEFISCYNDIIASSVKALANNRFACFIVSNIRDKDGCYYDLVGHTTHAFESNGMRLYNEMILRTPIGSLPVRAGRQFNASRKVGKAHQNVLVFYKGDPKQIKNHFPAFDSVEAKEVHA